MARAEPPVPAGRGPARVRVDPEMQVLELLRAFDRCAVERIELPDEMMSELERLVTARSLAAPRPGKWRSDGRSRSVCVRPPAGLEGIETDPSTSHSAGKVVFTVGRSYEILLGQAIRGEEGQR